MGNDIEEFKEFVEENCKDCKEICEKGIYTFKNMMKCADTGKIKKIEKTSKKY